MLKLKENLLLLSWETINLENNFSLLFGGLYYINCEIFSKIKNSYNFFKKN